jgi:acyl-CoA synthetase (AMP-forming)/AMP-acid ligase II
VEAALYADNRVSEASVFAIPDERLGEVPAAVVYSEDDRGLTDEDLKAALAERIAPFKVPAQIWIEAAPLPKLGTGKIDKMALRQKYHGA